jgi:hypothetical protein
VNPEAASGSAGAERRQEFGVLYFCDDNPLYRRMADISIRSLRRFHPDWPVRVERVPSPAVPAWKKLYRILSFWKRQRRRERAGQDRRVIARKAEVMLSSPFRVTLYLDADTVVMRPLTRLQARAFSEDVVVTPLPWKRYRRVAPWQPESWPYLMAGVVFYGERFRAAYRETLDRLDVPVEQLRTQEQFVLSLVCEMKARELQIGEEPLLQVDALNLAEHLGTDTFPRVGPCIDLNYAGLSDFHVFHYNTQKPQYLEQIGDVWGYG